MTQPHSENIFDVTKTQKGIIRDLWRHLQMMEPYSVNVGGKLYDPVTDGSDNVEL